MMQTVRTWIALFVVLVVGCGNPTAAVTDTAESPTQHAPTAQGLGEPVKPPFEVKGELDGLLLVWFDTQGVHTARTRTEIPEASRGHVRIESLRAGPDQRLDPEEIYVADVRAPGADGSYPVRKATRAFFDAQVDQARPPAPKVDDSIVVYKAAWCGACKAAEAYLRSKDVPFVEKDVEKDPGAQAEMQRKAQAKGLTPRGVPVIDFRGEILLGFDQARLESLIARTPQPI
jgi:glutaredoxin